MIPRWRAAIAAGVDFIATDQYEALSRDLGQRDQALRPGGVSKEGNPRRPDASNHEPR